MGPLQLLVAIVISGFLFAPPRVLTTPMPVIMVGVIGGMLAASGIAIFFIPAGFCLVERIKASITHFADRKKPNRISGSNPETGKT